ncbi:MAG: glycosyltransferase, partial [Planctomycetota bacterium]
GLGIESSTFVVGTVGALSPVKDQSTLIAAVAQAARSVNHLRLLLVGEGPLRKSLMDQAQAEGIADRVLFAGQREDVAQLLLAMDVYVCSSRSEEMSNAVLEALAAGLPVVSTDVGDHANVIRNERDGYIVPLGSSVAISNIIVTLAEDRNLCRRFALAARARAKDFDFSHTVAAYERYYLSLVSSSSHSRRPSDGSVRHPLAIDGTAQSGA